MAGVFKFLSPRAPPQPIDIQAAALWGVAAVTTALWVVQVPLFFFWLKLIYFTFYYFDDLELKTVVARRRNFGATATATATSTSTCFASISDHFVFSAFSHYYCLTFNFCDYSWKIIDGFHYIFLCFICIFLEFFSKVLFPSI